MAPLDTGPDAVALEADPDRLGQQATGDEGQRQRGGLIQPLRVIDDAQQRTLLADRCEQAQHRQRDEKPQGQPAETTHRRPNPAPVPQ